MRSFIMANILIIGNGFDLYHHIPTRYTDFLFFVNHWDTFDRLNAKATISSLPGQALDISLSDKGELSEDSIADFAKYKDAYSVDKIKEFDNFRKSHWVGYFNYLLGSKAIGKNWIDFEEEIQQALLYIENYFELLPQYASKGKYISYALPERALEFIKEFNKGSISLNLGIVGKIDSVQLIEEKAKYVNYLLNELNKLINCLNIYIIEFVSRIKCNYYSEQVKVLDNICLLNFNYTDTFKYVYDKDKLLYHHSIHGNAQQDNIVLGVPDDSFKGTEYIYFQKYFQRIQKKTGSFYLEWIKDKYKPIPVITCPEDDMPIVYIFGHSLAETDKGILKDFFQNDYLTKIIIFYHDQSAYENMVINLVKMFGKEFVISNTGSGRITFIKLESAKSK